MDKKSVVLPNEGVGVAVVDTKTDNGQGTELCHYCVLCAPFSQTHGSVSECFYLFIFLIFSMLSVDLSQLCLLCSVYLHKLPVLLFYFVLCGCICLPV